jgi:hypothetical protein
LWNPKCPECARSRLHDDPQLAGARELLLLRAESLAEAWARDYESSLGNYGQNFREVNSTAEDSVHAIIPQQRNLPDIIHRVGGALEMVMVEINSYVDQRFPLSRVDQIMIGRITENCDGLNTARGVDLLVNAVSFFGISGEQQWTLVDLISAHGIEEVHQALEYMYEAGIRSRGGSLVGISEFLVNRPWTENETRYEDEVNWNHGLSDS